MRLFHLLFIGIFLAILLFPWFRIPTPAVNGFTESHIRPRFSPATFMDSEYQKNFEKYYISRMPSRPWLLFLKNDLYDLLNWGQFHSGYSGEILQGSNGILFEKIYFQAFYTPFEQKALEKSAQELVNKLLKLKNMLALRGISFIIAMAPSKPDFLSDVIPWLWRFRLGNPITYAKDVFPYYEKIMTREHIAYVNCMDTIEKASAHNMAFPDTGIHWSMYAAALCLRDISTSLHAMDSRVFPPVRIKGIKITQAAKHEEDDLAGLLNLWPPYRKGKRDYFLAEFAPVPRPISVTVIGDSFGGQLIDNMLISGYVKEDGLHRFTNHIPQRADFLNALSHSNALIIVSNSVKFIFTDYLNDLSEALLRYLE